MCKAARGLAVEASGRRDRDSYRTLVGVLFTGVLGITYVLFLCLPDVDEGDWLLEGSPSLSLLLNDLSFEG